ncbi:ATP-dependent zinc protease [Moritella sp. 24]|uniref:ATP-dependent zinc protease family protein n=1 Tax=Moritella sp. 24 TaxID=2746230 RepID=UPI001BAC1BD2|nr:ATP-dependent zinc protease [Moritella sp. 24]QUM77317.1 ATP-dependent zinc protease [Moritella sp. 24]
MKNTATSRTVKTSKIAIASVLSLVFLNGCAMTQNKANTAIVTQQQAQIETILQQQQQILTTLQSQPDKFSEQDKAIEKLTEQLDELSADSKIKKVTPIVVPVESKADSDYKNKVILGQEEWVWIDEFQTNFKSRVDTGATTSSLNATDIVKFERDGRDWVKFNLSHKDDDTTFPMEAPVVRTIKIRQTNAVEALRRYVVSLPIELGDIKTETEFTLADRSRMIFPILLGRTFLKDIAIVDVAQEYTQPKKKPTSNKKQPTSAKKGAN